VCGRGPGAAADGALLSAQALDEVRVVEAGRRLVGEVLQAFCAEDLPVGADIVGLDPQAFTGTRRGAVEPVDGGERVSVEGDVVEGGGPGDSGSGRGLPVVEGGAAGEEV
jgi:hypothetical protein